MNVLFINAIPLSLKRLFKTVSGNLAGLAAKTAVGGVFSSTEPFTNF
jgi:hypothetical protein